MEMLPQDLRYAIRTLRKSRAFATVAIVTLALGIGASTAIFSVIENVLIAPFPYPDSSRLMYMSIHNTQNSEPGGRAGYSSSEFLDYSTQNHVFDRVTAASEVEVSTSAAKAPSVSTAPTSPPAPSNSSACPPFTAASRNPPTTHPARHPFS